MGTKKRYSFGKRNRLLTPAQFKCVFDNVDCKQGGRYCTVLSASNTLSVSRLGLIVAKRHLRLAVDRNKIKRIVRESFRYCSDDFGQLSCQFDAIVLIKPAVKELEKSQLPDELRQQWLKLIAKRRKLQSVD